MNTGAVQAFALWQLITPDPYSPPTTKAAFFIDGITMTHSARDHNSSGMPLSDAARSSVRMALASFSRFTSSFESAAEALAATSRTPQHRRTLFTICPLHLMDTHRSCLPASDDSWGRSADESQWTGARWLSAATRSVFTN